MPPITLMPVQEGRGRINYKFFTSPDPEINVDYYAFLDDFVLYTHSHASAEEESNHDCCYKLNPRSKLRSKTTHAS